MPVPFFDITRQSQKLEKELSSVINNVVASGRYILGENVAALEKEIAAYVGTKHAIGVSSGTEALHLALRACGVGAGDEVITSPFTFVATAEAIAYCGAAPVFVDVKPGSFNLDPSKIEQKITKKTKAILPVHLYGLACEMGEIIKIAKSHELKIIEDCAQAFGAAYNNQQAGSFGEAGAFSFFPTKNFGCFGDGGMVATNSDQLADEIRVLRGHGSRKTYHYDIIGYNSRLDELQAAILRVKLKGVDKFLQARREHAAFYRQKLAGHPLVLLPKETKGCLHSYNQFTLRAKKRDYLFDFLKERQVGAMVYYPLSLHLQRAFKNLSHNYGDFPESEACQEEVLSLPIFPELTREELETVSSAIMDFS